MVLFLLYKENKRVNVVADEMEMSRETVWRIKNRVLNKIAKKFFGGAENV